MARTGSGMHNRTRRKLARKPGEKGKINIRAALQTFNSGDKVVIRPDPSVQKNIPHRRFIGQIGLVKGKKGEAYTIEIRQGDKLKQIDVLPVHLKRL